LGIIYSSFDLGCSISYSKIFTGGLVVITEREFYQALKETLKGM